MIQRVIDDKYPNTRLLWQTFQQSGVRSFVYPQSPTMTFNRSVPIAVARSWDATRMPESSRDGLDKVVQRVIDPRYPGTRQIWIHSREEPAYLQPGGQRSRTSVQRTTSGVGLPGLNAPEDPRKNPAVPH
jgi:hypothetical protein